MNRLLDWKSVIALVCFIAVWASFGTAQAASVGQELANVQIRDANDKPATIPDFGTHLISLTYSNTNASDLGDPVNDAIKARNYNKDLYRGMGVANLKDSAVPNFIIRKVIKSKIEKYKTTILADPDLTLAKAWNLGNCKDKAVFILIGVDKKIKYIRYTDKNNLWNQAEIDKVLKLMDELLAKK